MSIVYFNSQLGEEQVRQALCARRIFVYPPRPSVLAPCAFARELTERASGKLPLRWRSTS